MKHRVLGWFCALVSGVALAAGSGTASVTVEASMLLAGSIVIAPDGTVRSHTVDQSEKLTPDIAAFIDKAVAAWKFVPVLVDGKPVAAKARMNVRLVADPGERGQFVVRVKGASFGSGEPSENISNADGQRRRPPKYPEEAVRGRAGGTVYLLLKVGRQGQVMDAAAEQVNLTVAGSPGQMAALRSVFAKSSVAAAGHWRFNVPTVGKHVDDPYWVARVPVTYRLITYRVSRSAIRPRLDDDYGEWRTYVPGPREIVPWLDVKPLAAESIDTTPEGGVLAVGQSLRLVSPLSGS